MAIQIQKLCFYKSHLIRLSSINIAVLSVGGVTSCISHSLKYVCPRVLQSLCGFSKFTASCCFTKCNYHITTILAETQSPGMRVQHKNELLIYNEHIYLHTTYISPHRFVLCHNFNSVNIFSQTGEHPHFLFKKHIWIHIELGPSACRWVCLCVYTCFN